MEIEILTHWNGLLESFPLQNKDVYFTEEYVKLYETETDRAECFVYKDREKMMLFPFISRSFKFQGKEYKDFETAYGYGGPTYNCDNPEFINQALRAFKSHCRGKGYVAGFVRFHPLIQNQVGFEAIGRLIADRKTVAINLNQSLDNVWMEEIHSKNRNVIRKAEKAGCSFIVDDKFDHLQDFVRLYDSTMDKVSADGFYYFDDKYYHDIVKGIPSSFLGCVANSEGQIISSAFFFCYGPYGHYHLSGSDKGQLSLSPNNFMLWNAACELKKRGVLLFHLGGGTNGDEDNSLYLFKRKFSKHTHQFYIGKLIFDEDTYNCLCSDWATRNPEKELLYQHHLLRYKY